MEIELLEKWEGNYRKGLLSFWMMMALAERTMYAYEMKEMVETLSLGTMSADENSIYRTLRRFAKNGLVSSEMLPSDQGPPRRYFSLTETGIDLLAAFIERNILVFENDTVQTAMHQIIATNQKEKIE